MNPLAQTQSRTSFIALTFIFMAVALAISGTVSYLFATEPSLTSLMYNINAKGKAVFSLFGWVVLLAPLGLVLVLGAAERFSFSTMLAVFLVFSVLEGMSLSVIFLVYTTGSVISTFFIAAGMFLGTALFGFATRTDLTKVGSIALMAVIGLIIATIVNIFLHSTAMGFVISIVGVIAFTALTAYDIQKLKEIGASADRADDESRSKAALFGALSLYLDFVNLFLYLLRLFGNRK